MNVTIPLLVHQHEFVADMSTRYLALCSGYGGGKTYAFCMKAIVLASQNTGHRGALLEPTNVMVRDVLIPMMDQVLEELAIPYEFSQSPLPQYVLHFAHGSTKILLRSGANWRRLVGLNLAFFGVDESDTLKPEVATQMWNQLMSRLRSGKVYQGFTTSTPEGYKWMHDFFVKQAKDKQDRRLIKARTQDNPFLPPEYIDSLMENYPAHLIQAYLNGEFVNLNSGTIYGEFDREKNHTNKTFADFPNHIIHVGQDFNKGNMASTLGVIDGGKPYILGEITKGIDTADVIKKLKQRFPNRKIIIYPDASGDYKTSISDLKMFEDAGFICKNKTKNPLVEDRINSVNRALHAGNDVRNLLINTHDCPEIVSCLERQVYKNGKPDKESGADHMNDALGYFIHWNWPIVKKAKLKIR